jgi:hypothetical protein
MDDAVPKKKKGKKGKGKQTVTTAQPTATLDDEELDLSVQWKGKKSEFFVM